MATRKSSFTPSAPRTSAQMMTLMTMAPFVIGTRMMQMGMGGFSPSSANQAEQQRMVTEKMSAGAESLFAMQTAFFQAATDQTMAMMTGRFSTNAGDGVDRIAAAGLRPYSKRVRSNRKRLSK